jgi:hypothetical protein
LDREELLEEGKAKGTPIRSDNFGISHKMIWHKQKQPEPPKMDR